MCISINCEWISLDWCCWQELFAEMLAQRFFSLFCQKVGFIRPCSSSARLVSSLCITFASHLFSCLPWAKLPEYYSICYFCVPQPACVLLLMHQHLRCASDSACQGVSVTWPACNVGMNHINATPATDLSLVCGVQHLSRDLNQETSWQVFDKFCNTLVLTRFLHDLTAQTSCQLWQCPMIMMTSQCCCCATKVGITLLWSWITPTVSASAV